MILFDQIVDKSKWLEEDEEWSIPTLRRKPGSGQYPVDQFPEIRRDSAGRSVSGTPTEMYHNNSNLPQATMKRKLSPRAALSAQNQLLPTPQQSSSSQSTYLPGVGLAKQYNGVGLALAIPLTAPSSSSSVSLPNLSSARRK